MQKIAFSKMVASGNDFVVLEAAGRAQSACYVKLAKALCHRKFGVGADGVLLLQKARGASLRMRVLNADGSEAEMCGNGARCVARYVSAKSGALERRLAIATKAGIIRAQVSGQSVKINLTDPKGLRLDMPLRVGGRTIKVNSINTGVPHVVVFVQGLEKIDVAALGRAIRTHKAFAPRGTNVNFVEILKDGFIQVRTYERGVEDETLACGTGSVASALVFAQKTGRNRKVSVLTQGGEVLGVYFARKDAGFSEVWLQGQARLVFKGEICL